MTRHLMLLLTLLLLGSLILAGPAAEAKKHHHPAGKDGSDAGDISIDSTAVVLSPAEAPPLGTEIPVVAPDAPLVEGATAATTAKHGKPTPIPTATAIPPTATAIPPTATLVPPTATATALPPTATVVAPTPTPPPTGSLAHWDALTVIVRNEQIEGCTFTMTATQENESLTEADRFNSLIANATRGMIDVTQTVLVLDAPLTTRTPEGWNVGHYYINWSQDLRPYLDSLGINHAGYDTVVAFIANGCVGTEAAGGGLTQVDRADCATCANRPGGVSVVYLPSGGLIGDNVMSHEWMHGITVYFNKYQGLLPKIDIDHPNRTNADGTVTNIYCDATTHAPFYPYNTLDIKIAFMDAVLGGNLEECANPGVQIGFGPDAWALGSPLDWIAAHT